MTCNDLVWRSDKLLLLNRNSSSCFVPSMAMWLFLAVPSLLGSWDGRTIALSEGISSIHTSQCAWLAHLRTFDLFSFFGLSRRGDFMWPCSLPWISCFSSVQGFPGKLKRKLHENDLFQAPKVTTSTQSTALPSALQTNNKTESNQELNLKNNNMIITYYIILIYSILMRYIYIYMHLTRQRRANFQEIFHRNFVHVWTIQKCYIFASMNPKVLYFWPGKETCVGSTVLHPRSFMDLSTNAHRWFKLPTRFIHFTMALW